MAIKYSFCCLLVAFLLQKCSIISGMELSIFHTVVQSIASDNKTINFGFNSGFKDQSSTQILVCFEKCRFQESCQKVCW